MTRPTQTQAAVDTSPRERAATVFIYASVLAAMIAVQVGMIAQPLLA